MAKTILFLTVHASDGTERSIRLEGGGPATIGNVPGCSIEIDGPVPFMFTLFGWDPAQGRYFIQLTDAIKGELFVGSETKQLCACRKAGIAQGVESLGIWSMEMPQQCSGYLGVAGVVVHFELEVMAGRESVIDTILRPVDEVQHSTEVVRRRRSG